MNSPFPSINIIIIFVFVNTTFFIIHWYLCKFPLKESLGDIFALSCLIIWLGILLYFIDSNRFFIQGESLHKYLKETNAPKIIAIIKTMPFYLPLTILIGISLLYYSFPHRQIYISSFPNLYFLKSKVLFIFIISLTICEIVGLQLSPLIDTGYCAAQGGYNILNSLSLYSVDSGKPTYSCWGHVYGVVTYLTTIPAHILGKYLNYPVILQTSIFTPQLHPQHRAMIFAYKWTQVFTTIISILGIYHIGKRQSKESAVALAIAYLTFPVSLFMTLFGTNDSIMIMFVILSLAYIDKSLLSGIFLGLAVQSKFIPVVLFPLFLTYYNTKRKHFFLGFTLGIILPLTIVILRHEFNSYINIILTRMNAGIYLSIWGLFNLEFIRKILTFIIFGGSALPLIIFWRKKINFYQVIQYGTIITSFLLFTHTCPHPGLVSLPLVFILTRIFFKFDFPQKESEKII